MAPALTASRRAPEPSPEWRALEAALGSAQPRAAVEELCRQPGFAAAFSELVRLWGIPQNPERHPEVDTGLHSVMSLEQAARLSPVPEVRFGALVHDLGKGSTPRAEWPRHKGHEERGVPLVDHLCRRVGAPASFRRLGMLASRWHGLAHKAPDLRPGTLLKMLEAWDAIADPEQLEALIVVGWADKRGRTGMEEVDYPAAEALRHARRAVARVPPTAGLGRVRWLEAIADCRLRAATVPD